MRWVWLVMGCGVLMALGGLLIVLGSDGQGLMVVSGAFQVVAGLVVLVTCGYVLRARRSGS